jgi:hypothetical protein
MCITKLNSSDRTTKYPNRYLPIITVKSQMNYLWFDGDDWNQNIGIKVEAAAFCILQAGDLEANS